MKKISELESKVVSADRELTTAHDALQRSYQHFWPAEIKLLIVQTSQEFKNHTIQLREIARGILQGILERYVAATGRGPSQERFREMESIALQAGQGDSQAFSELSTISSELIQQWAKRYAKIGTDRDNDKTAAERLKLSTQFWRNVAVTLQVLGLIVVLLKDAAAS